MKKAKVCFINVPLRDSGDFFPPFGITRLIDSLTDSGYQFNTDVFFYNIDLLRPSFEDMKAYFTQLNPDIVGISAVVSTSYLFVKQVSQLIKEVVPRVSIVLGGNMAAASEVVLKKTCVHLTVIGEGEDSFVDVCRHWETYGSLTDNPALRKIRGLAFKSAEDANATVFTGYRDQIPTERIRQANYDIIDDYYMQPIIRGFGIEDDIRTQKMIEGNRRSAGIELSKGCVSRCTFCHRWNKGYRALDLDSIIDEMQRLIQRHNVGVFYLYDESFGSDKSHIRSFIKKVKPLNVLWHVHGMRVKTVTDIALLQDMKDAGCVAIKFGMESGSDRMLTIMEKLATRADDNYKALLALKETGLLGTTTIQIVYGMPGENRHTVKETIRFIKKCREAKKNIYIAPALAQALPGTPLYEFARLHGFIGSTLDDEEAYLIRISDTNKADMKHYINMTEEKTPDILYGHYLLREMQFNFYWGTRGRIKWVATTALKILLTPYGFRLFVKMLVTYRYCDKNLKQAIKLFFEKRPPGLKIETLSLRKIVSQINPAFEKNDVPYSVDLLRRGR
ncbi:MAG: B12-binding domain-containing radical SAM protein [Deltaproteobacteria bacterium]|nr:B12-binding domain-containing radical SAM protein [Deltaproteobacteria bacterium]